MRHARLKRFVLHQRPHLLTTVRGTTAALTALSAAIFLGLACPYWAAMTALIVIQPTRGLLWEKSFYRLLGTAIGSSAALLLLLYTRSPLVLTVALCLWVAACVGLGNLLYGLRSYGYLMAGCTCVVIAMTGYQNPSRIYEIAFGRVACIMVGIISATVVTALFTPRPSAAEFHRRLDGLVADCFSWLALLLRRGRGGDLVRLEQDILIEVTEIESLFEVLAAGNGNLKKQGRQLRTLIASLLSLLAVGRMGGEQLARYKDAAGDSEPWQELLALQLEVLAARAEAQEDLEAHVSVIAAQTQAHFPLLTRTLVEIVASLGKVLEQAGSLTGPARDIETPHLPRHRDYREASRAAARAVIALAAAGAVWTLSGWQQGPLTLMAVSIMVTIFSTKEHPVAFLGQIFLGASTGCTLAIFCRYVLLAGVSNPYLAVAVIAPFVLLGVFAMTQRRTAIAATDATLFFMFVVQPGVNVSLSFHDLKFGAFAMLLGVGTAWICYRYLIPITPAMRLQALLKAILADLEKYASVDSPHAARILHARMQHRVLRMVWLAVRFDTDHYTLVEGGIAALAIARSIEHLRLVAESGVHPGQRLVRETLYALSSLSLQPGNPVKVLEQAANRLYGVLDRSIPRAALAAP